MASGGSRILSFDAAEFRELASTVTHLGSSLMVGEPRRQGVFPLFPHEATLTESFLDLCVLFFDRTVLYLDTFNLPEGSRLREKLFAYAEHQFISIFDWDGQVGSVPGLKADIHFRQNTAGFPFSEYVERLADLQTCVDMNVASGEQVQAAVAGLGRLPYSPAHGATIGFSARRYLDRLNGFSALAEALGVSILTSPVMTSFVRLKYDWPTTVEKGRRVAMFKIIDWFTEKTKEVPRFDDPSTLIRLRAENSPQSFVNFVVDSCSLEQRRQRSEAQITAAVIGSIEAQLKLAARIASNTYGVKKAMLSGLIATFARLEGGPAGAVAGGLAGTALAEIVAALDRRRIQGWTTYFLQ